MKHSKQHYIPRSYLEPWCDLNCPKDQTPYVWQFSKDGKNVKKKAPDNIFHENNMYTIKMADGSRDLKLEYGLSQLEGEFVAIRDTKISEQKPLDVEEHLKLCAFIAAMWGRTKSQRDFQREQWSEVLGFMEDMKKWFEKATPEQRLQASSLSSGGDDRDVRFSYEDAKKIVKEPMQTMLPATIRSVTPHFFRLDYVIFVADCLPGFITSDKPCVWFDPESYRRPPFYRQPALIYKTTEITFPISPRALLCFNQHGIRGYFPTNEGIVDEMNCRTRFGAYQHFIANSNRKRDSWFDPGVEPEDSWEKVQKRKKEKEAL